MRAGIKKALPKPDPQEKGAKEAFREKIVDTRVIDRHKRDLAGQRRASVGVMVNNRLARAKISKDDEHMSFQGGIGLMGSDRDPHSTRQNSLRMYNIMSKEGVDFVVTEDLLHACSLSLTQDRPQWLVGVQA